MKKGLFLVVTIACSFVFLSAAFSADKSNETAKNEWKLYSDKGDYAGSLTKEDGRFVFHDKDEISLEETKKEVWAIYNQRREFLGTMKKYKDSSFKLYDRNENYLGIILSSKGFRPSGAEAKKIKSKKITVKKYKLKKISPETITLYLFCLKATETIHP